MPREYHKKYSKEYYHTKREELIKLLGGICVKCGSTENLHFDHIDPQSRSFKIGRLLNYSSEELAKEVKKCQLLCRKCHGEKSKKEGSLTRNRQKGSEIKSSKLTEEKVKFIKLKIKNGVKHRDIAIEYEVSLSTIKNISCGMSWKHINID